MCSRDDEYDKLDLVPIEEDALALATMEPPWSEAGC